MRKNKDDHRGVIFGTNKRIVLLPVMASTVKCNTLTLHLRMSTTHEIVYSGVMSSHTLDIIYKAEKISIRLEL